VGEFRRRLSEAVQRLEESQSRDDGGWGAFLEQGWQSSIVNTAHALSVLRAAHEVRVGNVTYEAETVQRGLRYIAEKAPRHWQPRVDGGDPEARGARTRYAAFGLLGLTAWPEGYNDDWVVHSQCACVDWLREHVNTTVGGWRETDRPEPADAALAADGPGAVVPSLLVTPVAVRALARLPRGHPSAEDAAWLAKSGRGLIRFRACENSTSVSWPQEPEELDSSVSTSALAVLALATGTAEDREVARRAVRWLMSRTDAWKQPEVAADAPGANWHHMTFSLAIRAVLFNGSEVDSTHAALHDTIDLIDHLWRADHGGWSHGRPGSRATTTGTYAAVMAHEALRRAWPFDAVEHVLGRRQRFTRTAMPPPSEVEIEVGADGTKVVVRELDDSPDIECTLPLRYARMFLFLARRHEAADGPTHGPQAASARELADHLGIEISSVARYGRGINRELQQAARGQPGRVGDIVTPASDGPEDERLWRLAAWNVHAPASSPARA
jgi:hypothetical protein